MGFESGWVTRKHRALSFYSSSLQVYPSPLHLRRSGNFVLPRLNDAVGEGNQPERKARNLVCNFILNYWLLSTFWFICIPVDKRTNRSSRKSLQDQRTQDFLNLWMGGSILWIQPKRYIVIKFKYWICERYSSTRSYHPASGRDRHRRVHRINGSWWAQSIWLVE